MNYWLMKTEPSTYSWQNFLAEPEQTTYWEGIRNYQARNIIRDQIKLGDLVFFYHSVVKPPAIMGIAKVVRESYPDHYAWDQDNPYYDPKSTPENPRWFMVDIQYQAAFESPIPLPELKQTPGLENMVLLKKGSRLSVQPVTAAEWKIIERLRPLVS